MTTVFNKNNPGFKALTAIEPIMFKGSIADLDQDTRDKIISGCRYALDKNETASFNAVCARTIASVLAESHVAKCVDGSIVEVTPEEFVGSDPWTWAFDVLAGARYMHLRIEVKVSSRDSSSIYVNTGWDGPYKSQSKTQGISLRGVMSLVPDIIIIFTGSYNVNSLSDISVDLKPYILASSRAFDPVTNLVVPRDGRFVINDNKDSVTSIEPVHYY